MKLVDDAIPIQTLNFYTLSFAAVFLILVMPIVTGKSLRFPRNNLKDTVIIGILIGTQISVFNFAMTLVPIANAVIFWSIAPFFTFIFSALFLGERARVSYILIFVVALIGIVVANPLSGGNMLGNIVALGDGAIYAAMVTYMRYEGKSEPGNDIAWSMLVAALMLAPALAIFGPGSVRAVSFYPAIGIELPIMIWVAALGIISTGFAYFGISIVLKTLNANVYSLVDIIVSPVVATTFGYLIFSEVPPQTMVYGGAMLLAAGFFLTKEMSRGSEQRAAHPCQCN